MTEQQNRTRRVSAASIRGEVFGHRMRGLDEAEVREYLDALADQVEECDAERGSMRSEIERLRGENRRLREEAETSSGEVSPQAVALFSQAQQVADQLVEEAVTHARDLMMSARHQQRDIIQRAHDAAESAAKRAIPAVATSARTPHVQSGYTTPVPEIEYVRTFAKVAQVQLRSVLDALNDQVDRLSEVTDLDSPAAKQVAARESEDDDPGSLYDQIWSVQQGGSSSTP